jgi:uncharacterized membrane protein YhhN
LNLAPLLTPTAGLAVASLVASLVYGFLLLQKPPSALRTIAKTAAVGAIAIMAWLSGQGWLLAVGLTLSAVGDSFLAGDPKTWLPLGLLSFLLAHAAYLVLFIHAGGGIAMFRQELVRFTGVIAAAGAAVIVFRMIAPRLGPMMGPVVVYMLAIVAMVFTAFTLPLFRWPAMAGATAFFASDGILAVRLFRYEGQPNRVADLAVWWLYYGAQAGIATAFFFMHAPVMKISV